MIVLAFDTATPETVVGLAVPGSAPTAARHTPAAGERPGHAAQLLPLARGLLDAAGLTFADVDRIGIGTGPGTFTGLRIGVATARGLAQATGAEIVGIGTLAALADAARAAGHTGPLLALLDARRGEAFAARFADGTALTAPVAVKPEALAGLVQGGDQPVLAVGDGALRFASELKSAGAAIPPEGSALHGIDAGALCRLAAAAAPAPRDAILPEYVRAPDAVPRKP